MRPNGEKVEGGKTFELGESHPARVKPLLLSLPESREITKINAIVPSGKEEKREGEKWKKPFPEQGGGIKKVAPRTKKLIPTLRHPYFLARSSKIPSQGRFPFFPFVLACK